ESAADALAGCFGHGHDQICLPARRQQLEMPQRRRSTVWENLVREAFGNDVKVGIISVPSPDYDADHWWRYSEGVREVLDETIAYIYAKFFFWP
ncbi:MAG: hypothetical protein ACXWKH_13220, partial [Limisphaerales bacterium]